MPLTKKDIRTDEQLKADSLNPEEIKWFRRHEGLYYSLLVDLDEANEKKDYEKVIELEEKTRRMELRLLYQGKNPKEIPLAALREMAAPTSNEDSMTAAAKKRIKNPATAIRAFCMYCMSGQSAEIRRCIAIDCTLWPFRMGQNPFFGKVLPPVEDIKFEDDDEVPVEEETGAEGSKDAD